MKTSEKNTMLSESITNKSMIKQIKIFNKKIKDIRKSVLDMKWDNYKDTRLLLLSFLEEININTVLGLCFQAECFKLTQNIKWWTEKFDNFELEDVINDEKYFNKFEKNINDRFFNSLKDSYILSFYFEFETRIRNIVRDIGNVKNKNCRMKIQYLDGNESFYFISEGFFGYYLNFSSTDYEVVKIYSEIRNTIHNSGFYFPFDKEDKKLQLKGKTYNFKNEAPVNFITNSFIQDLIMALLELISKTLCHKKIRKINEIIDPVAKIQWIYN